MLNQAGVHICNMCGCPRAAAPASMMVVHDDIDNSEWQCMMCATPNPPERENCAACTYSKEKSVASLREQQMMARALAMSKQQAELAQLAAQEEALMAEELQNAAQDVLAQDALAENEEADPASNIGAQEAPAQDDVANAEEDQSDAKPAD